jgi:lipoate-protein ligase A
MHWHFDNTGAQTGRINMELDESLAHALVEGVGLPTVRVYRWSPPAISLGWNQSYEEIDVLKARAAGIDVVRRPTGGRAILHSDELTYCVVMPAEGKNILGAYEDISRALVRALITLGVHAGIEKTQPHFPTLYREASAAACFSSAGRYEIKWKGKKLIGSAQRRYACADGTEVVLQHGSILAGPDHKRLADFLNLPSEEHRRRLSRLLDEQTTDLRSILGSSIPPGELVEAVRNGFEETWGIHFEAMEPTPIAGEGI